MPELSSFIKQVLVVNEQGDSLYIPSSVVDNDFTGIVNVPTAGTAVTGGNVPSPNGFILKGHVDNTDTVWFFPVGRTKANGFPLNAGEAVLCDVTNLNLLAFDADANNGKTCWVKQ